MGGQKLSVYYLNKFFRFHSLPPLLYKGADKQSKKVKMSLNKMKTSNVKMLNCFQMRLTLDPMPSSAFNHVTNVLVCVLRWIRCPAAQQILICKQHGQHAETKRADSLGSCLKAGFQGFGFEHPPSLKTLD